MSSRPRNYAAPVQRMQMVPVSQLQQQQHAMGAVTPQGFAPQIPTHPAPVPQDVYNNELNRDQFNEIPRSYTITINLPGTLNATEGGSVPLQPELFELRRITWATDGDIDPDFPAIMSSPQARCVEVLWGDEFTKFLGERPSMVAAQFGDSQGYLDLVRPILFQGRQTLNVKLRRFKWPFETEPSTTRWDFTFQGISLLPRNIAVSGSM